MSRFTRGITNEAFLNHLQSELTNSSSYWSIICSDPDFFVAIRDNELNVYFKGQSLCRLFYGRLLNGKNGVLGEIHKKYVGIQNNGYSKIEEGLILENEASIKSLTEVKQLKSLIQPYVGKEKKESYAEIQSCANFIIDVEITFIREKTPIPQKKSDYEQSSIDYVKLSDSGKLVFFEAKHWSNKELRSRTTPKVINQIRRYEAALELHEEQVANSYFRVIKNLVDLKLTNREVAKKVLSGEIKLQVEKEAKLVVFGAKERNWTGKDQIYHAFGERLIIK